MMKECKCTVIDEKAKVARNLKGLQIKPKTCKRVKEED